MARNQKMPIAAMLIAIFNLILFVPCTCCSGFGLVTGAAAGSSPFAVTPQQKEQAKKTQEIMDKEAPNLKTAGLISNVAFILISLLMVVGSVGLLMKQSWGRLVCLLGATILILVTLAALIHQFVNVLPAMEKLESRMIEEQKKLNQPPMPQGFMAAIIYVSMAVSFLFCGVYPMIEVGVLMSRSVRDFYSGAGTRRPRDDYSEDDYDRRRDDEDDYDDRRRDDDR